MDLLGPVKGVQMEGQDQRLDANQSKWKKKCHKLGKNLWCQRFPKGGGKRREWEPERTSGGCDMLRVEQRRKLGNGEVGGVSLLRKTVWASLQSLRKKGEHFHLLQKKKGRESARMPRTRGRGKQERKKPSPFRLDGIKESVWNKLNKRRKKERRGEGEKKINLGEKGQGCRRENWIVWTLAGRGWLIFLKSKEILFYWEGRTFRGEKYFSTLG